MRSLTAVLAAALVLLPATPAWAANQPPVVVDDAANFRDRALPGQVMALANDSDPDGDPLVYTAVSPATKGTAYIYTNGLLYYQPYQFETGTDSFTYTVSDGQGNTGTGTVTITLWSDLPAPVGLTISSASTDSATLTWPAATDAVRYQVFRNNTLRQTTSSLSWTDTELLADRVYVYRIASVNGGGYGGAESAPVYRQPQLSAPSDLTVDVTDDPTALTLTWSNGGSGPWNVYRDGALVASSSTRTFTDRSLVTDREYSYQVQTAGWTSALAVSPPSPLSAAVQGSPVVLSDIGRLFWDLGWTSGSLGAVTVAERAIPGGRRQDHQNGIILQPDGADPVRVGKDFAAAYDAAGGVDTMGFPLDVPECGLRGYGCVLFFEGGSVWDSWYTPVVVVLQVIEDGWAATGWEEGPLGYPADDLVELPDGVWQEFEDGGVYWSEATGPRGVSGETHDAYTARGGATGFLGYPTTDETCGLRADGCVQRFQGGSVYWSPTTGAHPVAGAIGTTWSRHGAVDGGLGYPTTGEICGLRGGGCGQAFQGGSIHWSPATGAQVTTGAIRGAWARSGWENGGLGYPTTGEICGLRGRGCGQAFQGGSIHWSPATGAQVTTGDILYAWGRQGWENGRLGYPVSGATFSGGAVRQTFQGGTITVPDSTRVARITYR